MLYPNGVPCQFITEQFSFIFVIMKHPFNDIPSQMFSFIGNPQRIYANKFANLQPYANKLVATLVDCSEQTVNQNTNVAAKVCIVCTKQSFHDEHIAHFRAKFARKRTSGLTVRSSY